MATFYNKENPDPLQILLSKAHAIRTVNEENLAYIQSRKGQQIITKHHYSLQTKMPSTKKRKIDHDINNIYDMFTLVDNKSTKNINDIISAWRYTGEPLTKEKIAIDEFIDRKLVGYDDLVCLHHTYSRLLDQYSRILVDTIESRRAVEGVLRNIEILQVAIGEIHVQTLDAIDSEKVNDATKSLMKSLSQAFNEFHSKVSQLEFDVNFEGHIVEKVEETDIVQCDDLRALACRQCLSNHNGPILALETYVINGKTFLASASTDTTIKLWDLSNNTLTATLTGHTHWVRALVPYVKNGVQMLASGSMDNTIKLWNLSNNTNVQTLSGVGPLVVYEKDNKTILVCGSDDNTIKLRDLENYNVIATLEGHKGGVRALTIYSHNDGLYLASGSADKSIKIWSVDDHSLLTTIYKGVGRIHTLVIVDPEKKVIACGDSQGIIKLWSLVNYVCLGTLEAHKRVTWTLDILQCNGKVCLVSTGGDKTIKIWDLQNNSIMTTLNKDAFIKTIRVFMNGDRACLASGDHMGNIKLWME